MKKQKTVFLILALLLPVCVFIFLKIFGRNEFRVPVLHTEGVINAPGKCQFNYDSPYSVADTAMAALALNGRDSLYVFYLDSALQTAMNRVAVEFEGARVQLIALSGLPRGLNADFFRDCVLLMKPGVSVALVDHHNRIRGYYSGSEREEIDRLIVEIKIILKEY